MLRATSRQLVDRVLPRVVRPASYGGVVLGREVSTPAATEDSGTTFNKMVEQFALRGSELVIDKMVQEEKRIPPEEKRAQLKVGMGPPPVRSWLTSDLCLVNTYTLGAFAILCLYVHVCGGGTCNWSM